MGPPTFARPRVRRSQNEFPDDDTSVHEDNINCVVEYGIAQGFSDGTYRPMEGINRAQMATFIRNLVETATGNALAEGSDAFSDDDGNVHEGDINAIANAGIVSGFGDGTYRPGMVVPRDQMATYILNALDYIDDGAVNGSVASSSENFFPDDDGNVHEGDINDLAAQGIVQGQNGNYNPKNDVRRDQMATFVMHGAEYAEQNGDWAPATTANNQTITVTPSDAATLTVANPDDTSDDRQYTADGLDDTKNYTVQLFDRRATSRWARTATPRSPTRTPMTSPT